MRADRPDFNATGYVWVFLDVAEKIEENSEDRP
jgi:hypothetical protein